MDGKLQVVWAGVTAAMNVVEGGRGGVDIPDDELEAVHAHLASHYEEFGEEAPPLA